MHETMPATGGKSIAIASFYLFTPLDDCARLRARLHTAGLARGLRGTVLLAPEGINASIAGHPADVDALLATLTADPRFARLRVQRTRSDRAPFRRFKVKLRRELVGLGVSGMSPCHATGMRVAPAAWNALLARPDVLLIDTRNDYEYRLGHFAGAVNPSTTQFREFPHYVRAALGAAPERPIAMYCTGGIRCEKASALLLAAGHREVYQLEGGILAYLASTPPGVSRWQGDCFVFDERIALDATLAPADYVQCPGCRGPLSARDRASPYFEPGVCCAACHERLTPDQRAGFRERCHQQQLAAARGGAHLGAVMPARLAAQDR